MNRFKSNKWSKIRKEIFTEQELAELDLKIELLKEIIEVRHEKNMTQKDIESLTGIKQPMLTRIERGTSDPQISTLLKLLVPMGKKLAIVPIDA